MRSHLAEYQAWTTRWALALLPLLHPGALVFAFGGTRTWHRLACGFEDAGFQIWDTLMWLHGQGFPKAQDISKLIDKKNGDERGEVVGTSSGPNASRYDGDRYSETRQTQFGAVQDQPIQTAAGSEASAPWSGHKTSALKPAWEPIMCFKAPSQGKTYAELAMLYGSGALNVDGARIPIDDDDSIFEKNPHTHGGFGWADAKIYGEGKGIDYQPKGRSGEASASKRYSENGSTDFAALPGPRNGDAAGRYPANLALDEESAAILDEQTQHLSVTGERANNRVAQGQGSTFWQEKNHGAEYPGGVAGASRFFYCAKASRSERDAGLDGPLKPLLWSAGTQNPGSFQSEGTVKAARNNHPTVKPIDLCRWLATLLLPPDSVKPRRLLVPFCGSGSEMIGAMQAGWDEIVGVEQDEGYCKIAEARIARERIALVEAQPSLFEKVKITQAEFEDLAL